jgi:hypothetical protein
MTPIGVSYAGNNTIIFLCVCPHQRGAGPLAVLPRAFFCVPTP